MLPTMVSSQLAFHFLGEEAKNSFQDGDYDDHLGFPIGKRKIAFLDL